LKSLEAHEKFRLFLSMEVTANISVNLLRLSRIFVFQSPFGVKANLLRVVASVPPTRMDAPPSERSRVYFLLAWLHMSVLERLRYCPIGRAIYVSLKSSN
jgi:dynein heavy chain 1